MHPQMRTNVFQSEVRSVQPISLANSKLSNNTLPVFSWRVRHGAASGDTPVKVRARHSVNGLITPLLFREGDAPPVNLKSWNMRVQQSTQTRGGGSGLRYTFTHGADKLNLFLRSPYVENWEESFRENPQRVPVEVLFDATPEGLVYPLLVNTSEGGSLCIDEILHVAQRACQEAGIQGIRYVCGIGDRHLLLYLEGIYWVVSRANLEYVLARQT